MSAVQKSTRSVVRILLMVVILCNAVMPTPALAQPAEIKNEGNQDKTSIEKHDKYVAPVFARPEPRVGQSETSDMGNRGGNEREIWKHANSPFTSNQNPYYQTSCATSGDLVIVNGQTCSLAAGTYTFNSILIRNGGL